MGIKKLSQKHKAIALETLKNFDTREIAEKFGLHRWSLYRIMEDPLFKAYCVELCNQQISHDIDEMYEEMINKREKRKRDYLERRKKKQLVNALKRTVGVANLEVNTLRELESAIKLLLESLGIEHTVPEGRVYLLTGCNIKGEDLTIGLRPGEVLIIFGDAQDIREADKTQMLSDFEALQQAILCG